MVSSKQILQFLHLIEMIPNEKKEYGATYLRSVQENADTDRPQVFCPAEVEE